ncbi:MAG: hypothetical protein KY452_06890 [Actinobacteria bacterium]|nr:hypothetical protein [Actinomycetota bacterium]
MRDRREALERLGATAVAVGFSPPDALARLADHLEWPWPFLTDTERTVYARLGLRRASLRDAYSTGTMQRYREAAAAGEPVHAPVEDARQLGGDAVVRAGRVLRLFRPATPDDRPPVDVLVGAVAQAAR